MLSEEVYYYMIKFLIIKSFLKNLKAKEFPYTKNLRKFYIPYKENKIVHTILYNFICYMYHILLTIKYFQHRGLKY